jgi:predicted nucleic acid-binding protein
MTDKIFLDTNILVYAHDRSSGDKNVIAREIMEYLWEGKNGVLSVQVLQEFYVCATQKILKPLTINNARSILEYLSTWNVVVNDKYITLKAIEIQERYRFSFWDSLIIQAAIQARARFVFSEDLPGGQTAKDLKILNPFKGEWRSFL